ncbi:MAG: hypothetical protein WC011_03560 [Candidatus Paceibacterota bacterium]
MAIVINSTYDFFNFYAKAYFRSVGIELSLNLDNYTRVIERHYDYYFIKDMLFYTKDKTDDSFLQIKTNLNSLIEVEENKRESMPAIKVSLMKQIIPEGYSYDFSGWDGPPNSILFS